MKDADAGEEQERAATTNTSTISLSASAASSPNPAATPANATASNNDIRGDRGNDGSNKSRSRRVSFAHSHRSDNIDIDADVVEDPPSTVVVTSPAVEIETKEIRRVSFAHLDDNKGDVDLDLPQTRATATDGCNGELTLATFLVLSSVIALLCYPKRC